MTLRSFSGGYYKAEMSVQPYEDGPAIEQGLYDFIATRYYSQTSAPVTMRIGLDGGPMFVPATESAIPTNVLAAPEAMLDDSGVHPSHDSAAILILKPQFAYMFQQTRALGESFDQRSNVAYDNLTETDKKFFNLEDQDE